jgi:hypothetical protein
MKESVFAKYILANELIDNVNFEIKSNQSVSYLVSSNDKGTRLDEIVTYNSETLEEAYDRILSGQLMSEGYFLVNYEGAPEIINYKDGTNYTIYQNSCSCGSYEKKCKHLSFYYHNLKLKFLSQVIKTNA